MFGRSGIEGITFGLGCLRSCGIAGTTIWVMSAGAVQLARAFTREIVRPSVRAWESSGRYPRELVAGSGLTGMFSRLPMVGWT